MWLKSVVLLVSLLGLVSICPADAQVYHVEYANGKYNVLSGPGGLAEATLTLNGNITGWHELNLRINTYSSNYDDQTLARAAGYLEGVITRDLIWDAWFNFALYGAVVNPTPPVLSSYILQNLKWMDKQVVAKMNDPYWQQVALILAQAQGMLDGYNDASPPPQQLSVLDWHLYILLHENEDLLAGLGMKRPKRLHEASEGCSVLIRLSPDGQRLMSSHDTWTKYSRMLRIFKHYNLQFRQYRVPSPASSQSSFPAHFYSGDDWFVTDQRLVITETTNSFYNDSVRRENTSPESVPYWIRVLVATRLATNGRDWASLIARYNNGAYNNQWIIVDYKLFTPGQPLKPGTLWIAEQIPGFVQAADMTPALRLKGFWKSYNIPFFPEIYNISGYPAKKGDSYSYQRCPRSLIFERDAPGVSSVGDLQALMRSNRFQTDPFSQKDACKAISARCDLNTPPLTTKPFGGIDCKITDQDMIKTMTTLAVAGPTWTSQSPFEWTDAWDPIEYPRQGLPHKYAFDWLEISPSRTN